MIEKYLYILLLVYSVGIILVLTLPPVLGIVLDGIEGLKDGLRRLVEKEYYSDVLIPTFALITYSVILAFLIAMFII